MFLTAALVVCILPFLVMATPLRADNAISIPIRKRNLLTRTDNTFNHDQAIRQKVQVLNKYRTNLINIRRNTGRLPVNVTTIPPLANLTRFLLGKRQRTPLVDLNDDSEWGGNITIGTGIDSKVFLVDFDTGSADLWVPSSSCQNCGNKTAYDPSQSSTSVSQNATFNITYGDGSSASGSVYTDIVTVGTVTVSNQTFAAVTTESPEFVNDPAGGILGLGFPAISNLHSDPFLINAFNQMSNLQKVFGLKLAKTASELYIGGTNGSAFTGDIENNTLSSADGFWQLGGATALVDGVAKVSEFQTVIDSGTTIMYGPPDHVGQIYAAVPGAQVFDETNGLWSYPCATPPTIAFQWLANQWSISAENLNLGETALGSGQCVGALAGQDLGLGSDVWLLGDSFMKNVYTVFSVGEPPSIGFATLA